MKLEKDEKNKIIKEFENTLKEKDNMYETMLNNIKNEYQQRINEQIDENENMKSKYVAFKIERDKYFGEFNILKDEYEKMKNEFRQENINMLNIQKQMDDDYQRKINILNDKSKYIMAQNNELKNENNDLKMQITNILGKNNFDEKLAKNGEELYKELIMIKKENEELKKQLENYKK